MPSYKSYQQETTLNNLLKNIMNTYNVIGCSLVVIQNKKPTFEFNYGDANIETKEKISAQHSIRIASISKLLSSIILLSSLENNLSILNSSISQNFNIDFKNPHFEDKKITLKELLTHTSSFEPSWDSATKFLNESLVNSEINLNEIIIQDGSFYDFTNWKEDYPPGKTYAYSDFNYLIATALLEKITKKRFDQLAQEKLIKPLNLNNTHLATSYPINKTHYAIGYAYNNDSPTVSLNDNQFYPRNTKNYQKGTNPTIHAPQSGFRSNIKDLTKIMLMLMNKGENVLSEKSIEHIENAVFKTKYIQRGLGSEINYELIPNIKMIGHTGNAYGILTHFFYNRELDFGIIFIINGLKNNGQNGDHLLIEKEIDNSIYETLIKK